LTQNNCNSLEILAYTLTIINDIKHLLGISRHSSEVEYGAVGPPSSNPVNGLFSTGYCFVNEVKGYFEMVYFTHGLRCSSWLSTRVRQ